jgi:hypothetical protein
VSPVQRDSYYNLLSSREADRTEQGALRADGELVLRLRCSRTILSDWVASGILTQLPLIDSWPDPFGLITLLPLCRELAAGQLDVALVSSFEYLRNPVYSVVDHVAISSRGPVLIASCSLTSMQ